MTKGRGGATPPFRILHLEDSGNDAELIREHLVDAGFAMEMDWASNADEFAAHLHKGRYDLVIADYLLPGFDAPSALALARSIWPKIPFIVVSGAIGEERAVDLLKQGATDYVLKDRLAKLPLAIERAFEEVREHEAREQAEEALRRLNRELRAIGSCNETMMRAKNERDLLGEVCRIVCEVAGYQMAWVGYAQHDRVKTIRPVARSGVDEGYLEGAVLTWADPKRGCGLVGSAIQSGKAAWCQNIATDPEAIHWRDAALKRGYRSCIALPLMDESEATFGVLDIYATEPDSFTPDEVRVLEELARDLAFGLGVLRARLERNEAEKALAESEAKLRSILDNIDMGVCLIGREMEILEVNEKMRVWYPELDSMPKPTCFRLFNGSSSDEVCENCPSAQTLRDGKVHEAVMKKEREGAKHDYRVVSSPVFGASGEVSAVIEMVEDITDKLILESQYRQAQKMEAIGRLAGGVAHDFNNALNVMLGHTEIALDTMTPDNPVVEDLQGIRQAVEYSAELTQKLLAFARKQSILPKALDLNEAVEGMLKMLRRLIGEDIDLVWKPGTGLWSVHLDPTQVDQVLANLCVNARDAIEGTGRVRILTHNVVLDTDFCAQHPGSAPGDYVVLVVSDDGCGMDEDVLGKMFEPFFTTKPPGKGTGLGMATVYGIVEQNKGFIEVDSGVGRGTTFEVYLPRHLGSMRPTTEEGPSTHLERGSETVLLVEDELANLDVARRLLERLGYRVLYASTPSEAIRVAEQWPNPIHLLLSDVILPEMTGPDLARHVLDRHPELRCLYMSGYSGDILSCRGVNREGFGFIQKPFTLSSIAKKIREVLHGD